ncbi:MAG: diaminopimelate epimerase [Bacteroidaceae bacterium]|nr:diaminopimelate epimerase [Bacteroidaceae bacterium]
MINKIKFTKMHGASNDYIYIDTTKYPIADPEKKAIKWSKFHTGIGSDGIILIGSSDKADFSMRIFNADGSEAMMCGNGSRCIGKYVYDNGLTDKTEITLETLAGIKILKLHLKNGEVNTVTVDMGKPEIEGELNLKDQPVGWDDNMEQKSTKVSMGNPHLVTFVDDIKKINLTEVGPKIEHLPVFPDRTNTEFAQVIGKDKIRMRVWERGSGITLACGTGACATEVAAFANNKVGRKSEIIMDGGSVEVEWDKETGHILMTGDAVTVFTGEIIDEI